MSAPHVGRPDSTVVRTVRYYRGETTISVPIIDPADKMYGGSAQQTVTCPDDHAHRSEDAAERCVSRIARQRALAIRAEASVAVRIAWLLPYSSGSYIRPGEYAEAQAELDSLYLCANLPACPCLTNQNANGMVPEIWQAHLLEYPAGQYEHGRR